MFYIIRYNIGDVCKNGFMLAVFTKTFGSDSCEVSLSDSSKKTNGLVLIKDLTDSAAYCLIPGYYYVSCNGPAEVLIVHGQNSNKIVDLRNAPYGEVVSLDNGASSIPMPDFDKNVPINGQSAYPQDGTDESSDFTCDQAGYLNYLSHWPESQKCTSRDVTTADFQKRLEYFIESCEKIHEWNLRDKYKMEFTFYADWHPEEFEELTVTTQRYTGVKNPVPSTIPVLNNSNWRYLMPSSDPCDDVLDNGAENTLRATICKPQNCSVSWAFAVTNSIEYAIKKLYLDTYDQIVEVALSAQELIDCVGKDHGIEGSVCSGMPIIWGFDYVFDNGINYRRYYPHINYEDSQC